ncbi:hypothetical protein JXA48_02165 [Candidatus Woesearchaeota archaeon]|nr:hypothetical protein [Candidatus Woesearchaeota archaeon]
MKFQSELQELKREIDEEDFYDLQIIEEEIYNDEIDPEEEAFMRGYLDALA